MPVYEPGKILDVILESDKGSAKPPVWKIKALSCREAIDLGKRIETELASKSESEQLEAIASILAEYIVGWEGLPVEYGPDKLLDVTSPRDLWRLDSAIRYQLGVQEKKA